MSDLQSGNTPTTSRRRMQVVAEREVADPEPVVDTTTTKTTISSISSPAQTTTNTDELIARVAWRQGVLGALAILLRLLAARMILLFAVLGAIGLAWLALSSSDYIKLAALAVYLAGALLPLVWLASRG